MSRQRTCRVVLQSAVNEARETSPGRWVEDEIGHWHFEREIRLPFLPYRGLVLATECQDKDGDPIEFVVRRVVWDLARGAWVASGDLRVVVDHESTEERVREEFPGWSVRWVDLLSFDDEGRLLPERQNAEGHREP